MSPAVAEPLRAAVLAGRFLGDAPAVRDVARIVSGEAGPALARLWFGDAALAAIAQDSDPTGTLRAAVDRDIAAIDRIVSRQLDAVYAHRRLRRLEGSWRGLQWLVERLPRGGSRVRLRLLQVRWSEVCRDLERAVEFDQSQMFRKIHDEQFGTAGGEPYGLLACDFDVRHAANRDHPTDDVTALKGLGSIGAAAFAPMVVGASPALLGVESFSDLTPAFDPQVVLEGAEHQRWRQAAQHEDLRFVGVLLPRVLGRAPWRDDGDRADRFRYRGRPPSAAGRVWTSPVYAFAAAVIRAFERYAWPGEVRGAEIADDARGGVIDSLPFERFPSDPSGGPSARAPLDLALTDRQEDQIADSHLVPLSALDGLPEACFGALPSLYRPPAMRTTIADTNQRVSSQLNTLLCVSRFAHCVKLMGRDMVGSFLDPSDIETRLQRWLDRFVSGAGLLSPEDTARYPLREARVEVRERRGAAGTYNCIVHLRPHHQLDDIGAAFRLVTEFSQRNANA